MPLAQKHFEKIGSAQVKSAILLAGLNTPGITQIEVKRNSAHYIFKIIIVINISCIYI